MYTAINKSINDIDFSYVYTRKKEKVCDNIIAFDIETTSAFMREDGSLELFDKKKPSSYYEDKVKVGLCYFWSCAIEYNVFYGRDLESFVEFLSELSEYTDNVTKYIYVHNLAFEFQWLRNVMEDMKPFARKERKPIYFSWREYEFRCSYMLTRLSLASWAKTKKLEHQKLVGDLDYNVMRTPYTDMKEKEKQYGFNDVLVMVDGIRQYKERFEYIWNIPLTQTGIVRRELIKRMKDEKKWHYKVRKLIPDTIDEYTELVAVFGGGTTRANRLWTDYTCHNVRSRDETSAYPWAMVSEKFPITKFSETDHPELFMNNSDYSYIIYVELYGIKSKYWNCYLSLSKCESVKGETCDNGRILEADYVRILTINIDYEIILKSYDIDKINIINFKYAINGYLNDTLCRYVLELFKNKTEYKNVKGMEEIYHTSKEELNSMYGMAVTRTITDDISMVNGEWHKDFLDAIMFNDKVNKMKAQISKLNLSFAMGVYIPAMQRRSLWNHVYNMDEDIVYMDTDSVKYLNYELYEEYFSHCNAMTREKQEEVASRLGVDISWIRPIAPDGTECSLGEYVVEEDYSEFRTLGAKRYCYNKIRKYVITVYAHGIWDRQIVDYLFSEDDIHITVSGVAKSAASQLKCIEDFTDGYYFDMDHAKKMILHYQDDQPECIFNEGEYDEYRSSYKYAICAQPTGYKMSLTEDYFNLVQKAAGNRTKLFADRRTEKYGKTEFL